MNNPYEYMKKYEHQTLNYDKFCDLMGESTQEGKKKLTQFKTWSNYMNLEKGYNKITIYKVYNVDEMLLISHNVKFTEYIADLIVMYLASNKDNTATLTYREFAEYFYMVNTKYYKAKYKKNEYMDNFKIQSNMMYYPQEESHQRVYSDMGVFFNITDTIIKKIIKNALKSLKNRGIIVYSDTFKIYKTIATKDGFITKTYICDEEQKKEFLDIRKSMMRKYNIDTLKDIIYLPYDIRNDYFDDLKTAMIKSDVLKHCSRYANAFTIEYGDEAVEYEYKRIVSENRNSINNKMQYRLLTTKELDIINNALKNQFVNEFINTEK